MKKSVHQGYAESSKDLDRIRSIDFTSSPYSSKSRPYSSSSRNSVSSSMLKPKSDPSFISPYRNPDSEFKYLSSFLKSPVPDLQHNSNHNNRHHSKISYQNNHNDDDYDDGNKSNLRYSDLDFESVARRKSSLSSSSYLSSSSSIINSFHELQSKVKLLERQRFAAIEEREDLKQKIAKSKRELILWKNKNDFSITDNLLSSRSMLDRARIDCQDLELKIKAQEEVHKSIQQGIVTQESMITQLTTSVDIDNKVKIQALERRKQILHEELSILETRSKALREHISTSTMEEHSELKNSLESLQREYEDVLESNERTRLKIDSLKKYIEIIIEINSDLCDTLITREESKANILRLAEKYTPPRYAWPKNIQKQNYEDILDVVNDAATASALEKRLHRVSTSITTDSFRKLSRSPSKSPKRRGLSSDVGYINDIANVESKYNFSKDDQYLDDMYEKFMKRNKTSPSKVTGLKSTGLKSQAADKLEKRAAHAIAQATTAASILASKHKRMTQSAPISKNTNSNRKLGNMTGRRSSISQTGVFLPSSSSRESKEFNKVALQSSRSTVI